jgi:hypothetical protein
MQRSAPAQQVRRDRGDFRFLLVHPTRCSTRAHIGASLPDVPRRPALALLITLVGALGGCDRSVTSVGAWSPPRTSGPGGQSGGGAAGAGPEGGVGEPYPESVYLEAESGELSGGFAVESDAAASQGQYLLAPNVAVPSDSEGAAQARYDFSVPSDGEYVLWGRIYSPDIETNRFHVQVDGGTRYLWRITVGSIWYWDDIHDDVNYDEPLRFPLTAGKHELVIGHVAANARLDRLYLTASGDEPPGNDTACRPPHSIDTDGVCQPSCGAQALPELGTTCECAGRDEAELFPAYDCGGGDCCFVRAMP